MRIVARSTLVEYYQEHPQAEEPLENWYRTTLGAKWRNFADIKNTFNTVSQVGRQHYVFNIRGNKYRLVVVVKFVMGYVFIRFVGTHNEYEKINAAEI